MGKGSVPGRPHGVLLGYRSRLDRWEGGSQVVPGLNILGRWNSRRAGSYARCDGSITGGRCSGRREKGVGTVERSRRGPSGHNADGPASVWSPGF